MHDTAKVVGTVRRRVVLRGDDGEIRNQRWLHVVPQDRDVRIAVVSALFVDEAHHVAEHVEEGTCGVGAGGGEEERLTRVAREVREVGSLPNHSTAPEKDGEEEDGGGGGDG